MSEEMIRELKAGFEKIYGNSDGIRIFFAPGRVNLIGEHTDYNGGHVFPCALSMGNYAAVRVRNDRTLRLSSINFDKAKVYELSLDELKLNKEDGWTNYSKGVIWAFGEKGYRIDKGFDMLVYGDIPAGAGLSSSASLEVLTGLILKSIYGFENVTFIDIALLGQKAENEFVGMNCGIMDQFASAMGKEKNAIFLDTNTLKYEYAPLELKDAKVVITNSNVKHELASSEYNTRRRESEEALKVMQKLNNKLKALGELTNEEYERAGQELFPKEEVWRRGRHAVSENIRTIEAAAALRENNLEAFGRLMNESHVSMRDDYEISCPEIDHLVETAWTIPGVLGSRMTGGGFGGCIVSIVRSDAISDFKERLSSSYKEKFGLTAMHYIIDPGEGAHEL